jgi:hypothetical protein
MSMMPKVVVIVAATLLLAACQQAPVRDEASPRSRVNVGSTFVLHEGLTVPSGHARVFLQGGSVVAKNKLNRYYPHCNFEVRTVSDGTLRIEPDTFLVTEVVEDQEQVVTRPQPLRVARLSVGDDNDGGVTLITRFIRHRLSSERQPGVMRLTCHGGFDVPFYAQTPGIAEIRQALGEVVTLNLARE